MAVRMLLKSWATPPASRPTASTFCACRICSCRAFCSVMSSLIAMKCPISPWSSATGAIVMRSVKRVPSLRRLTSPPYSLVESLIVVPRLQQGEPFAVDFRKTVTSQFTKGRVDPFNHAVAVGQHDGIGGGLQRCALQTKSVGGQLLLRHIGKETFPELDRAVRRDNSPSLFPDALRPALRRG